MGRDRVCAGQAPQDGRDYSRRAGGVRRAQALPEMASEQGNGRLARDRRNDPKRAGSQARTALLGRAYLHLLRRGVPFRQACPPFSPRGRRRRIRPPGEGQACSGPLQRIQARRLRHSGPRPGSDCAAGAAVSVTFARSIMATAGVLKNGSNEFPF